MNLQNLDNLVKTNQLKTESFDKKEFVGLVNSGKTRLHDATNTTLASESRFDLAYNAAHSLALAALRWHNYRPNNRYVVFQVLPNTVGLNTEIWRVLAKCHDRRNIAEYEGHLEIDDQLLNDLLKCTHILLEHVLLLEKSQIS